MANQIVKAEVMENGNFRIEFKALDSERLSTTGETIQVAGTLGWAEPLGMNYPSSASGNNEPLTCAISVRYANPFKTKTAKTKTVSEPLTKEKLLAALAAKQSKPVLARA